VTGRWLPAAAFALPVLVIAAFAVRPYVSKAHSVMANVTEQVIAAYERDNHLPVDPSRTFAEISLHWVFWYIGVPVVILGTVGAALLARRCVQGRVPLWTLPLITFAWTVVTFLYRPAITPDQPWASRRLVPVVLPAFILLAAWASSWLVGWLDEHGYAGTASVGSGIVLAAALVLPATLTTFGLGVRTGGPAGVTLVADGMAFKTTYRGELDAVNRMCAAIPRGSSVVIIDGPVADRLTEAVRGMCGDPAVRLHPTGHPPAASVVKQIVRDIQQAGRRPVLLAANESELAPYDGLARSVMTLNTTMDVSTLMAPPRTTKPLKLSVWMWEPTP
jgi:hypothetical protein